MLSVLTFRTPEEAVEKANNTPYGLSAGVWTEKGSRILWMAQHLRAGVVWANTFNRFDPTSPFGGYKESGFGREGGLHGLEPYLDVRLDDARCPSRRRTSSTSAARSRARSRAAPTRPRGRTSPARRARTRATRSVAARGAQAKWAAATAYNRGQVLYRVAEMMEARAAEFAGLCTGPERGRAGRSIAGSGTPGFADKLSQVLGGTNPVAGPYFNFTIPEPTGVVAIVAPNEPPLLGLVSRLAPALVGGNAVVALASETHPARRGRARRGDRDERRPGRRRQHPDRPPRRARALARVPHGRQRDRPDGRRRTGRRPGARGRRQREARRPRRRRTRSRSTRSRRSSSSRPSGTRSASRIVGSVSAFDDVQELVPQQIWDGVVGRSVHGAEATLSVLTLEPEIKVPEHSHVNEQIGVADPRLGHVPDRRRGERSPAGRDVGDSRARAALGRRGAARRFDRRDLRAAAHRLGGPDRTRARHARRLRPVVVPGSRRLSQRISEGDGIAIIVRVADAESARVAEAEGAKARRRVGDDRRDPRSDGAAAPLDGRGAPGRRRRGGAPARSRRGPRRRRARRRRPGRGGARAGARAVRPGDLPALRRASGEHDDPLDAVLELLPDVPAGKLAIADVAVAIARRGAGARARRHRRGARAGRVGSRPGRPRRRSTFRLVYHGARAPHACRTTAARTAARRVCPRRRGLRRRQAEGHGARLVRPGAEARLRVPRPAGRSSRTGSGRSCTAPAGCPTR